MPKTERCKVNEPNVRNPNDIVQISDVVRKPNCLATEQFSKMPKSERSDFELYVRIHLVSVLTPDVRNPDRRASSFQKQNVPGLHDLRPKTGV